MGSVRPRWIELWRRNGRRRHVGAWCCWHHDRFPNNLIPSRRACRSGTRLSATKRSRARQPSYGVPLGVAHFVIPRPGLRQTPRHIFRYGRITTIVPASWCNCTCDSHGSSSPWERKRHAVTPPRKPLPSCMSRFMVLPFVHGYGCAQCQAAGTDKQMVRLKCDIASPIIAMFLVPGVDSQIAFLRVAVENHGSFSREEIRSRPLPCSGDNSYLAP